MDNQVFEEFKKYKTTNTNNEEGLYPEHEFLISCLRIGLKLDDLKLLSFVDIIKLFISYIGKPEEQKEEGERMATQEEIQKIVAKM